MSATPVAARAPHLGPADAAPSRRTALPLPARPFVPGTAPHPGREPGGHDTGPTDLALRVAWGADLFDAGAYWEAHEAWEPVWQREFGGARVAAQGLILLAGALLKARQGNAEASRRMAARALERLEGSRVEALHGLPLGPAVALARLLSSSAS